MKSLPLTLEALAEGRSAGLHLGAQLYVSLRGEVVFDGAIGESRPGVALRPDDLPIWLSACKPVAAVAIAQLWERGRLDIDDPVAAHLPEFAVHGKGDITLRHLLTHTAGLRMLDLGWPGRSLDEIVRSICARKPEPRWRPGWRAGYHHASSWFLLGAIVARTDGRDFSTYVRDEIFVPIGMVDSWIGMPAERFSTYRDEGRLAPTWNTEADDGAGSPVPHPFEEERSVVHCSPGGNGRGPARELGLFYEMLLAGGRSRGGEILAPQTVAALTARHRVGLFDQTFQHEMDWGLGFILDGKRHGPDSIPYGYGQRCSLRTFGHSGYRSTTAFGDPESGLAVALIPNGTPSHQAHEARTRRVLDALYGDLGLAEG